MKAKMRRRIEKWANYKKIICPNCKEWTQGHFVPPSLGQTGFFICAVERKEQL